MEFFQSTYFLIGAVTVVVLLLALLLLLRRRSSRTASPQTQRTAAPPRRQSTAPAWPGDKDVQAAAQPAGQTTPAEITETTKTSNADLASVLGRRAPGEPDFSTSAASAAQKETPPAPAPRVAAPPKPLYRSTPAGDPVRAAVTAIASGRGPLESAETRRLELYRPDRILQVTEALKTEELTSKAPNHLVLDRLRAISDYASFVMVQVATTHTEPAPEEPRAAEPESAAEEAAELQPAAEATAESKETQISPQPDLEPGPEAPTPHESPVEKSLPESAPEVTEIIKTDEVRTEPLLPLDTTEPGEMIADDVLPAEVVPAVPEAVEEEAPEEVEAIEIGESPLPLDPVDPVEPPAETYQDAAPLNHLTAEDLAGIPKEQWGDAFSRLSASETCRLFETSENRDLKMQLVDHVEARGGADALLILDTCLRDPDPEVQLHALNAAEKLLKEKN